MVGVSKLGPQAIVPPHCGGAKRGITAMLAVVSDSAADTTIKQATKVAATVGLRCLALIEKSNNTASRIFSLPPAAAPPPEEAAQLN